MSRKQRLELTWIGKDERPHLEPRILIEDQAKSHHATHRVADHDLFDNRLIFGDNLLALKALEAEFAGKVKCVFIDPPYNTGSAFDHYDDGVEHSIWLSLLRDRLELLRGLLAPNGSLWVTIDDNECHYLKILCDEVFGRQHFVANVVWQKAYTSNQTAKHISNTHDHVLVYAKEFDVFAFGKVRGLKNGFGNIGNGGAFRRRSGRICCGDGDQGADDAAAGELSRRNMRQKKRVRDVLAEMEQGVAGARLVERLRPFSPKGERGRPPIGLERMLRIYFCAWYGLAARRWRMRSTTAGLRVLPLDLGWSVPDATTLLNFRLG